MGRLKKPWLYTAWVVCFGLIPNLALGASTIYLDPEQDTYTTVQVFDVAVKLDTGSDMVKKVEGGISFDNTVLSVQSINTDNSAVNFWLVAPTFVNNKGKISFVGEVENRSGENLELFSISFASKKIGTTHVSVSFGRVLSADGINIAGALGSSLITIDNPLTYDLEPPAYTNPNTLVPLKNEEARIRIISTELLYRIFLIIIVLLILSLSWLINNTRKSQRRKK